MSNAIRRESQGSVLRGTGESLESYINRLRVKLDYLARVCEVHFAWYTHRNHAGCWICDAIVAYTAVLNELERQGPFICEGQAELVEEEGEGTEPLNGEVPLKDS